MVVAVAAAAPAPAVAAATAAAFAAASAAFAYEAVGYSATVVVRLQELLGVRSAGVGTLSIGGRTSSLKTPQHFIQGCHLWPVSYIGSQLLSRGCY